MSSRPDAPNALILALSGIGNLLMQLPAIEALKKERPRWRITVWVAPRGTRALLADHPTVAKVIEGKIKRGPLGHLAFASRLRQVRPDIAIMLSPGQLWKGALYMAASGARERIAHSYPHLGQSTSHFLLTKSLPEARELHDIEQNLKLLELLDISIDKYIGQPYHFVPPADAVERASKILNQLGILGPKTIIGLHAGSAGHFLWKRWPLANFVRLGQALIHNHHAHLLLFSGPAENSVTKDLQDQLGIQHTSLVYTDLLATAALMKDCQLFLANDSGLMHLASACGVPTLGIFGPTDEAKTGPRGPNSHVIRAAGTKPSYDTETNFNLGSSPHPTLTALAPAVVLDSTNKILRALGQ